MTTTFPKALMLVILAVFLVSCGENEHIRLGKEWMEIGKNGEAVHEFMIALQEEPKSEQVRYLLAQAYLNQGRVTNSLKWRDELIEINPSNKNISSLDKLLIDYAAKRFDENEFYDGVIISAKIYDDQLVPGLVNTIMLGRGAIARDAFNILASNNSAEVLATILEEKLSERSDPNRNKLQLALFLWEINENDSAAKYIVNSQMQKFLRNDWNAAKIISNLTPEYAVPIFLRAIKISSPESNAFKTSNQYLSKADPSNAARVVTSRLSNVLGTSEECGNINGEFVEALLEYPKDSLSTLGLVDLLKKNLGFCLTKNNFRFSQQKYLNLLSRLTGDIRWKELDTWYDQGGWGYFNTLLNQFLNRITNEKSSYGGEIPTTGDLNKSLDDRVSKIKNDILRGYVKKGSLSFWKNDLHRDWTLKYISLNKPDNIEIQAINNKKKQELNLAVEYMQMMVPNTLGGFPVKGTHQEMKWVLYDFSFSKN